jgi:hypothetical protein
MPDPIPYMKTFAEEVIPHVNASGSGANKAVNS